MIDVLILFEHSGLAALPFTERGYSTCIVDKKNSVRNPRATYTLDWDILEHEQDLIDLASSAQLVIGMPPCTDLTAAGAKHWEDKEYRNPGFQAQALHLFKAPVRIATRLKITYVIENPKGAVSRLWRKPNYIIHPFEFGGWLPEDDVHPDWPQYIPPRDAYPKETHLWCSDDYKLPIKRFIPQNSVYSDTFKKLGGKSEKTKEIRSASPRGLFVAMAQGWLERGVETR